MQLLRTATPKIDESLFGYLLRLTELNGYERPDWILGLAGFNAVFLNRNCPVAFKAHDSLDHLAYVIRRSIKEVIPLAYPQAKLGSIGLRLFNGLPVHQTVLHPANPKLCPDCLQESAYCRRIWDLSLVTVCLKHKRLLIDECPNCRKRIRWLRGQLNVCPCGYDWRQSPTLAVTEAELSLAAHLYRLCNIGNEIVATAAPSLGCPAFKLTLRDFATVMTFIAKQFQRAITMKSWALVVKNQELHQIYTKAYAILADWPDNYYSFLDWRQEKERNALPSYQKSLITTTKDFGGFYTGLQTTLAGKQFKFMRTVFKRYLQEYPNGRQDSAINIYMPQSEAMRRLQMNKQRIHQLAKAGHLKVKVIKRCGQSIHLIEIASIRKLESNLS